MFSKICKFIQPSVIVDWAVIIASFFYTFSGNWNTIALIVAAILLVGHLGEWVIVKSKLESTGHQGFAAFAKVMVFGFTWWIPILSQKDSPED